ncbi:Conjugative transfer protein TrbL [Candidatus Paraburkholderia calva]|nr:Conjugative transfer protein TrbL [Candidatus Paraburkholderia calva]
MGAFQAIQDLGALDAIAVVIPVGALAILMFLVFLFVAAQLLVTQIESFIRIGAGVILLGFGGSRWTTDMSSKYMQYAVATGLKLMVLYVIVVQPKSAAARAQNKRCAYTTILPYQVFCSGANLFVTSPMKVNVLLA